MSTDDAAKTRLAIDRYREELGRTGDFSMVVSLNDAVTVEHFRRAEEVGVTDLLTMPWVYYGGFDQSLDQKIAGTKRFADEVLSSFST